MFPTSRDPLLALIDSVYFAILRRLRILRRVPQ